MAKKLLMKARVDAVKDETDRVKSITLRHANHAELKPFVAGDYVTINFPSGMRRQYSICSDPADITRYRLGVLRTEKSRGCSTAMHDLQAGDTMFISYPQNTFALVPDAKRHILIAGGIGITPILSMVHDLARKDIPFEVHYCATTYDNMAFLGEVTALCPEGSLYLYASNDEENPSMLDLEDLIANSSEDAHFYCCGPQPMTTGLEVARQAAGVPENRVHTEQFSALDANAERYGEPFEIQVVGETDVIAVSETQSALQALRENGHYVPSSCEGGICGECRIKLESGEAVHRDAVLRQEERRSAFITCVSRGKGKLIVSGISAHWTI